jgi:hypothetical protein
MLDADARPDTGAGTPASQEVSWWVTHVFITELVAQANTTLPWAGTPAWSALPDTDPRKLLSLAVAGEHHVLRVEIGQEQRAQAAEDVHGGDDWAEVARLVQRRREIDKIRRAS